MTDLWYRARYLSDASSECRFRAVPIDREEKEKYLPFLQVNQEVLSKSENIQREKELFLKASLQLLDNSRKESAVASRQRRMDAQLRTDAFFSKGLSETDVILFGPLKKATRRMGLNAAGDNASAHTWKHKYVELKHGLFTYISNDGKSYGNGADMSINSGGVDDEAGSRAIILRSDSVSCNVFSPKSQTQGLSYPHIIYSNSKNKNNNSSNNSKHANDPLEDCMFEIVSLDSNKKRLFMAGSAAECEKWVSAIRLATVGWLNASNLSAVVRSTAIQSHQQHNNFHHHHQYSSSSELQLTPEAAASSSSSSISLSSVTANDSTGGANTKKEAQHARNKSSQWIEHLFTAGEAGAVSSVPLVASSLSHHTNTHTQTSSSSLKEGPSAPYAGGIAKFVAIQHSLSTMQSVDEYRSFVRGLIAPPIPGTATGDAGYFAIVNTHPALLKVPIFFVTVS